MSINWAGHHSHNTILIIQSVRTQTNHIICTALTMEATDWSILFFLSNRPLTDVIFSTVLLTSVLNLVLQGSVCVLPPSPRESLSFIAELFIFWPLDLLYSSVLWLALQAEPCPRRQGEEDEMKDSYRQKQCERSSGRSPLERIN